MSNKVNKDIKAVAMIGALIWLKSERAKSHTLAAKLIGNEYIRIFREQLRSRVKELKKMWKGTPRKERDGLRRSWVQTMKTNSENADLTQLEIDMAREITRNT